MLDSWNPSVVCFGFTFFFPFSESSYVLTFRLQEFFFLNQTVAQSGSLKANGFNQERTLRRSFKVLEAAQD